MGWMSVTCSMKHLTWISAKIYPIQQRSPKSITQEMQHSPNHQLVTSKTIVSILHGLSLKYINSLMNSDQYISNHCLNSCIIPSNTISHYITLYYNICQLKGGSLGGFIT